MTKITVFGQEEKENIIFTRRAMYNGTVPATFGPLDYQNVGLLWRQHDLDVFIVWGDTQEEKAIYFGHWNDGVVG